MILLIMFFERIERCVSDDNKRDNFQPHWRIETSKVVKTFNQDSSKTRNNNILKNDKTDQKAVRSSYKNIDTEIIEVMVNMESQFSVEQRQVAPLLAYIMSKLVSPGSCLLRRVRS